MQPVISIKRAALINASGKYSKVILALLVNAILARILTAEDFGVIAVVTVFTTLFTSVADMGFGTAVVQRKDLTKSQINDIFTFTGYVSMALAAIFFICGWPIATFFGDSAYVPLCQLLSVSLFFNAFNMVPNGIMNREKRFKSLALRTVVVYAVSSAIAILLALCGASYYSLAWQSVISAFATFAWNVATTRPSFTGKFEMASVRSVLSYSGYQFAFNLVTYLSDNIANFVTGKLFGSLNLGYYSQAATLTTYPTTNLAGVITPVLHPILSDYSDDKPRIYRSFLKVSKLLAYVGVFVGAICFLASDEIVRVMYGEGWELSANCLRWLAIAIMPSMMNASVGGIFQALGNTKLLFINSCINTAITFLAIFVGAFLGGDIVTLSFWVGISRLFHLASAHYMLVKLCFGYPMLPLISHYRGVMFATAIEIGAIVVWMALVPAIDNVIISLVLKAIVLAGLMVPPMLLCGDGNLLGISHRLHR